MQKFLFTDGTSPVRELQSVKELEECITRSSSGTAIRIWVFNSNQWLTLSEYRKSKPLPLPEQKTGAPQPTPVVKKSVFPDKATAKRARAVGFTLLAVIGLFLVYNFTRLQWYTASALEISAARPDNVPVFNIDSLINVVEVSKGKKLDKLTRTNFRIRNSWPEKISLQLQADRDSSREGLRFHDIVISIDNSTGYALDKAEVLVESWKAGVLQTTDTIRFSSIAYSEPSIESFTKNLAGDSLSVSFLTIQSKAFNFCYARNKKSNYGNDNDKWFCRD